MECDNSRPGWLPGATIYHLLARAHDARRPPMREAPDEREAAPTPRDHAGMRGRRGEKPWVARAT